MVRDFSDEQKRILLEMVREVQPDNIFEKVVDFFDDFFHRAIIRVNINDYLNDMINYHRKMIDYDNASAAKIEKIFNDVAHVDDIYKNYLQRTNGLFQRIIDNVNRCSEAFSLTSARFNSQASVDTSNPSPSPTPNTGTYVIKRGDTLTAIAQKYNTTVAELVRLNNISNPNLIITGNTLRIPISSVGAAASQVINQKTHTGDMYNNNRKAFLKSIMDVLKKNNGNVTTYDQESIASVLNSEEVLLNQVGKHTCTLCSIAMLLRREMILKGDESWSDITEQSIRSTAWVEGQGIKWDINVSDIRIKHNSLPGGSANKNRLIELLKLHPEGIVLYNREPQHAVLLTDYTNGEFYCSDPVSKGRKPLTQAYSVRVENADDYWFVEK